MFSSKSVHSLAKPVLRVTALRQFHAASLLNVRAHRSEASYEEDEYNDEEPRDRRFTRDEFDSESRPPRSFRDSRPSRDFRESRESREFEREPREYGGESRGYRGESRGFRGESRGFRDSRGSRDSRDSRDRRSRGGDPSLNDRDETLIDGTYTKNYIEGKEAKSANIDYLEEPNIEITGIDPAAVKVFGEKKLVSDYENLLHPVLIKTLTGAGISQFSPIQRYTLPLALRKRADLLGNAQTGSGKTIAFLLPLINDLLENNIKNKREHVARATPRAIIIAPTRELANQLEEEFKKYARGSKLLSQVIIGGTNISMCKRFLLERNPDVLVCTPGRMNALLDEYMISLSNVRTIVLDEADLMVDMGFMPQIQHFFSNSELPSLEDRQTFLFSATMPASVRSVINQFMKPDRMHVQVGVIGKPGDNIKQDFVSEFDFMKKCETIKDRLSGINGLALVFAKTKSGTLSIALQLKKMGIASTLINGDMSQASRNSALTAFKQGKAQVLVATDIASRGLDIPMVDLVVNFELPQDPEAFVHRIGRTGRAGREGTALSFVHASRDKDAIFDLVRVFKDKEIEIPDVLREEVDLLRRQASSGRFERDRRSFGGRGPRGGSRGGDRPRFGDRSRSSGFQGRSRFNDEL